MVKDSFIFILSFVKENEKKFSLKPKNTFVFKGIRQVGVITGGYRVFVTKQSKKMYAYMTLRENSWNPFEDLKVNFINGTGEIDMNDAHFDNIIVKDKLANSYYYWYWNVKKILNFLKKNKG